jgi:hypothetical protein
MGKMLEGVEHIEEFRMMLFFRRCRHHDEFDVRVLAELPDGGLRRIGMYEGNELFEIIKNARFQKPTENNPEGREALPPFRTDVLFLCFLCGRRRDLVLVAVRAVMLRLDAVVHCRDDAFGLVLPVLPLV